MSSSAQSVLVLYFLLPHLSLRDSDILLWGVDRMHDLLGPWYIWIRYLTLRLRVLTQMPPEDPSDVNDKENHPATTLHNLKR